MTTQGIIGQVFIGDKPISQATIGSLKLSDFEEKPTRNFKNTFGQSFEATCHVELSPDMLQDLFATTGRYDVEIRKAYHLPRKAKKARRRPSPKNLRWQMLADRIINKSVERLTNVKVEIENL